MSWYDVEYWSTSNMTYRVLICNNIVFNRLFQTINIDPNIGVTVDNNLSWAVSDDRYYRNLYLFIKILITVFGWLRAILKKKNWQSNFVQETKSNGPEGAEQTYDITFNTSITRTTLLRNYAVKKNTKTI